MSNVKRIIEVGRVQYEGKQLSLVTVEVELKDGRLSLCGNIWNRNKSACFTCGQISNTLRELYEDKKFAKLFVSEKVFEELLNVWDRWHLNDLKAGCEHQRKLGWDKILLDENKPATQDNMAGWTRKEDHPKGVLSEPCPTCGYKYGTEWKKEELPDSVVKFVTELVELREVLA